MHVILGGGGGYRCSITCVRERDSIMRRRIHACYIGRRRRL